MKKAVILARVSTLRQEKEGLSLQDIQLPILRDYAKDNDLEVVREFVFSESADRKIRTKFNEMIAYVKSKPDISAIIAYRVDRITRNYRDAVLIDDLRNEHAKEIHFVYDRLIIGQKTTGRDITDWDTKVYLAKQFLNRLKDDAVTTAQRKLANGEWPNGAPFGYKNAKDPERNRNWIFIDENEAQIVVKVYEWYNTGSYSMLEVRNKVKEVFGIKIAKSKVEQILNNKFYFGVMVYDGVEYPHFYDRIIKEDTYLRAKAIRESYNKKPFKFAGLPFSYRGLIRCAECGCVITPEKKTKKSGLTYHYYHCTQSKGKHGAEWLSEQDLTNQFVEALGKLQLPQEAVDDILTSLKGSHDDKKHFADDLRTRYQAEYDKYQKRIERMYEDQLDGRITKSFFEEKRDQYRAEQRILQAKLANLQNADEEYYLTAQYLVEIASRAKELFMSSEPEEKRLILKMAFQNLSLDGKIVRYEWKKPFDKIAFYASRPAWLPRQDSNLGP
ncbi:MAG: recombinase family protein [Patescibacteria group bacterium]|nr:recombinase family protein [Patescibacteria group bacterium]